MFEKLAVRMGARKLAPMIQGKKTYIMLVAAASVLLHTMLGGDASVAEAALQNPGGADPMELVMLLLTGAFGFMKAGANRAAKEQLDEIEEHAAPSAGAGVAFEAARRRREAQVAARWKSTSERSGRSG